MYTRLIHVEIVDRISINRLFMFKTSFRNV